jgi:hypothetical protein
MIAAPAYWLRLSFSKKMVPRRAPRFPAPRPDSPRRAAVTERRTERVRDSDASRTMPCRVSAAPRAVERAPVTAVRRWEAVKRRLTGPHGVRTNLALLEIGRFAVLVSLKRLARPRGVEPLTPRSVVWCSIQLSYGRLACRGGATTAATTTPPPGAKARGPNPQPAEVGPRLTFCTARAVVVVGSLWKTPHDGAARAR